MIKPEVKSFAQPDELRRFPLGKVELVTVGGFTVARETLEPGWRWSTSLHQVPDAASTEAPHFQYHVSGTLMVAMEDGKELECKAGDVCLLPVGHDAWVVGDEPVVLIDFQGMLDYANIPHR